MTTQELDTDRNPETERVHAGTEGAERGDDVPPPRPAERSWDALAEIALGERRGEPTLQGRVRQAISKPTLPLVITGLVLAAFLVRAFTSREETRGFPGRAVTPAVDIGESVVLEPGTDAAKAPEVTIHDAKPALEVILVGVPETDPGVGWKVVVSHPGREIWKSKWERRFERVKDEWRLGFELDGRDLPEGPLTITLVEAKPRGGEANAKREPYRLRVKRRG
jgi:hypothetical protein